VLGGQASHLFVIKSRYWNPFSVRASVTTHEVIHNHLRKHFEALESTVLYYSAQYSPTIKVDITKDANFILNLLFMRYLLIFEEIMKGKGKGHPRAGYQGPEVEWWYSSTLSLPSGLDGYGWLMPHPDRFIPGKDPISIVQEDGWHPGPVRKAVENLAATGIRSPERQPVASHYTD
jgi:hypothetical protein